MPAASNPLSRPTDRPRVLVTGLGVVTALGTFEGGWRDLKAGRTALERLPRAPAAPTYAGAAVGRVWWRGRPFRLADLAHQEAFRDAGFLHRPGGLDAERTGVVVGTSKGDVARLGDLHRPRPDGRPRPDCWLSSWPNFAASHLAHAYQMTGPCLAPVAACATGLVAALQGADLIRRGVCDVVFAGAADASLNPFLLGAFHKMGVLARVADGDDPARAVRPWDRARAGFLVGEGAAVLVLEREDHATARDVLPYCEFAGGAVGADAYHMTDLNPDPSNLAGLIGRALQYSGVDASEIDHINVHGTATRSNDPLECRAIRRALGPYAGHVSCSANKAQIGHCLGAAGAVELAFTALAVRDGFAPPTVNLDDPDPACDLDGTPHVGRARPIRAALKLSIGFGGHLAAAVLKRYDGPRREPRP